MMQDAQGAVVVVPASKSKRRYVKKAIAAPVAETAPALEIVKGVIRQNGIKAALVARGLTQEETARRVGVSYRQMNRVVLNQSDPSLLLATKIACVLGESLDTLFEIRITTRQRVARS